MNHLIKLFHTDHEIMMGQKSLVREIYDEMIFVDPSPTFYRALLSASRGSSGDAASTAAGMPPVHHETDFGQLKAQSLARIEDLNEKVSAAIVAYREQLKMKKDIVEEARLLADDIEATGMGPPN